MTQWAIEDGNISEASGTATNILSGLAKAWLNVSVSSGTPSLDNSLNISSIVDNGVGNLGINFSAAFSSSAYSCGINGRISSSGSGAHYTYYDLFNATASDGRMLNVQNSSSADPTHYSNNVCGDLA